MKRNRLLYRTAAWLVWSVISGIGFFLLFWLLIAERDPYGLIAVIFPVFSSLMLALFLYEYPSVSLDEQGVRVKWWLVTHFYLWSDICQAGISCFYPHGFFINRLVLVRTGCSKRGYRDSLFHFRNFGKLIYIPVKSENKKMVLSCYGPLDFDLTDGKMEQSIVIDE